MVNPSPITTQRGTTMIEVLVTIVILVFGLLGLAGLQARLQVSEMESYQRAQALVLLEDMASRIATNRANAASYDDTELHEGNCPTATATVQDVDKKEWCNALAGAAETTGGSKVGAMIGGRGCIEQITAPAPKIPGEYMVTVAWQGLAPISAPSVACGAGSYGDDRFRRTVTTIVSIGIL